MSISRRTFFVLLAGLPLAGIGTASAESQVEPAETDSELQMVKMDSFSVAGFQYYQGHEVVRDIRDGEVVTLVPEPDNPHDCFAVEMFRNGIKLGYVPRTNNEHISRLLQQGVELHCEILDVNPSSHSWGAVMVDVFLMHACWRS